MNDTISRGNVIFYVIITKTIIIFNGNACMLTVLGDDKKLSDMSLTKMMGMIY